MKYLSLYEEFSDYERRAQDLERIEQRKKSVLKLLNKRLLDLYEKYLKPLMTDDEWDLLKTYNGFSFDWLSKEERDLNNKQIHLRNRIWTKLQSENKEKYEELSKETRKLLDLSSKNSDRIFKIKNTIEKGYNIKRPHDPYFLKGNKNSKYLYHFTKTDRALSILEDDELQDGGEGISFTTNKDLIKRNPIFWHPSKYAEGVHYKNLSTCFVLDFDKIKQDKIKIKAGSEELGTHMGEEEIRIMEYSMEVKKYLLKVIYDPSKEKNKSDEKKLLDYMKSNGIKYFLRS